MEPLEYHTDEESGENLEKLSIKPLLYVSSLVSLVIWGVTFIPYLKSGVRLFVAFSDHFNYVLVYLLLFFAVLTVLVFYYRHVSLHMERMSRYVRIFGVHPAWLIFRTGNVSLDWAGLIIGMALCVLVFFHECLLFRFFPGFMFLTLSFLFALLLGNSRKWKMLRR